eukprot:14942641-Alexandrium_andersonii.AAC.1
MSASPEPSPDAGSRKRRPVGKTSPSTGGAAPPGASSSSSGTGAPSGTTPMDYYKLPQHIIMPPPTAPVLKKAAGPSTPKELYDYPNEIVSTLIGGRD